MKILITQLGTIGDMILHTPAIKAINEKYPEGEISILAGRRNYEIIAHNPRISKIYVFRKSPINYISLGIELKREKFEYYIDAKDHYSWEGSRIAKFVNARKKIGYNVPNRKIYDYSIPGSDDNRDLHFIERIYNALGYLNIDKPSSIPRPELFIDNITEGKVLRLIQSDNHKDYILVNISSGSSDRLWEAEKWIDVVNAITKIFPVKLVNMPSEKKIAKRIAANTRYVENYSGLKLMELMALVKYSQLVITPDTSVVHIASGFDKPLIGLYSGNESNFKKFAPLSSLHSVVKSERNSDRINAISSEEVIKAINDLFIKFFEKRQFDNKSNA